jgi:hypothetical protein
MGRSMKATLLACLLWLPLSAADSPRAVPEWVVAGIAAVETGSTYRRGRLVHYRDQRIGTYGEVGPWQISPMVLRDLSALHLRHRVASDVELAERLARRWLLRCYQRTGSWSRAVAAYHAGGNAHGARARTYAQRVRSAGIALAGGG